MVDRVSFDSFRRDYTIHAMVYGNQSHSEDGKNHNG